MGKEFTLVSRLIDRNVQSSKMVHAALLLLMLGAVARTSFHHRPEAQHPAFHKLPADHPHLSLQYLPRERIACLLITLREYRARRRRFPPPLSQFALLPRTRPLSW